MSIQTKQQQKTQQSKNFLELFHFEKAARQKGFTKIAGIDEAGRGPLAGPVVAASCILADELFILGVDDSKKLTPLRREKLFYELTQHDGVSFGVGVVSSEEIDQINIFQATKRAMSLSIEQLSLLPDYLLVDGLELSYSDIPCQKIIRGDSLSHSIGAASIIAKVTRDQLMLKYHEKWPEYGFDRHKGYGTKYHREALLKYGPCPIHRRTFEPVKSLL